MTLATKPHRLFLPLFRSLSDFQGQCDGCSKGPKSRALWCMYDQMRIGRGWVPSFGCYGTHSGLGVFVLRVVLAFHGLRGCAIP